MTSEFYEKDGHKGAIDVTMSDNPDLWDGERGKIRYSEIKQWSTANDMLYLLNCMEHRGIVSSNMEPSLDGKSAERVWKPLKEKSK